MIKIGSLLRAQRHLQGKTQRQVAEGVGCGVLHYTKIETGGSHPSIELLEKILTFLHCDFTALIAPEIDPKRQKLMSSINEMILELSTDDLSLATELIKSVHTHRK
jgi:transcriptional regulator with XRE-family HTH domain